jgi:hypothetical protein
MNEVAKISDHMPASMPVPQATSSNQLLAVLSRMMADPSVDIERIERGAALYERALARDAETAFNGAMAAAQSEMRHVAADANNPQTKSKYATYAALDAKVRPIYSKHGFSISFDTGEGAPEGCIRIVCFVALGGHSRAYHIDMPADGKGAKGGDVMTKTHATGAGVTYGRRYLLGMIFNLVIGEDTDGNMPPDAGDFISQAQVATLVALSDEVNADKAKFCAYFKVPSFADIKAKNFQRAIDALNSKRTK